MKRYKEKIGELAKLNLKTLEEIEQVRKHNIIPFDLPKDVLRTINSSHKEIAEHLKQVSSILEKTRQYITNRAREEISHQKHTETYSKLDEALEKETDLEPEGWAQFWLMTTEIWDLIDQGQIK